MPTRRLRPAMLMMMIAAALPGGCTRDFSTEGDRLRRQVMELEAEKAALAMEVQELKSHLAAAERRPEGLTEEAAAATPALAAIAIDRRSHLADVDGDGRPDVLRVYVKPSDGRGRFLPLVGELAVSASAVPAEGSPVAMAQVSLSPLQVRDAFRSSFLGTQYAVECPLQWQEGMDQAPLAVSATFIDALSGLSYSDLRQVRWLR